MKTLIVSGVALAICLSASVQAAETIRYAIVVEDGTRAGEQVVEHGDDGHTRVDFIFKDNGRGPELKEEYTLRADGTFATYKVTGTTTFGAPIDEQFSNDGTLARWKSTSEEGSSTNQGALYVPLGGTPQAGSVAMALMARSADRSIPLLPGGTLRSRVVQEVEVESDGERRTVQLLAQTGLGLSPQMAWATRPEPGKDARLFAFIVPGYLTAVEEGWERNADTLRKAQVEAEAAMVKEAAARLRQPLPGLTVIRNARPFDSVKGTLGAPSDVYLMRGRITAVLPAGAPNGGGVDNEIDAEGRVLLPGLFDMHGHVFGKWEISLHLAAGVTTVRDLGNDNKTLQELIGEIERGEVLGPRVVTAGFLEGQSEHSARLGFVVKNLDEARNAIDWYSTRGYPQLKIYNSFPYAILKDTVAYAHSRGMRVSGHIPVHLRAQDAIDAGFDELQHINQLMLNFFVTPETDTRTLERFRLPAEMTADLDFDSPPVQDFIASIKRNNVTIDPTLATFDYIRQRPGEISRAYEAIYDHLPLSLQRRFRVADMDIPDDATAERYNRSYGKMVEFVGRLHKAGITVVPGTDAIEGFTLHRELELFVQAGMTPAEALQSATSVSARVARVDHERGRIEPGLLADLVLVDGEPTRDISAVRKTVLVVTQGVALSPGGLFRQLGIKEFVNDEPVVRSIGRARM